MNPKMLLIALFIPCITKTMDKDWHILSKTKSESTQQKPIHEELMQISKLTRAQATPLAHCNIDTIELLRARIDHLHGALKEKDTMILQAALTIEMLQEKLYAQDILMEQCQNDLGHRDIRIAELETENQELQDYKLSMQVLIQKHKNEIELLRQAKTNLENMQHLLP